MNFRKDFLVSVKLKKTDELTKQIDEENKIVNIIAKALNQHGYRYVITSDEFSISKKDNM